MTGKGVRYQWMLVYLVAILVFVNLLVACWYNIHSPFWLDEIIVGSTACKPNHIQVLEAVRGDPSPPTHWLISHVLFRIFGCELMAVRIANALLVAVGLCLLVRVLYSKYGFEAALLYAAMFAGSFAVTYYCFEARMYGLLIFSSLCMLRAVILARWHMAVVFACFAASLHLLGWFLYAVLIAVYILLYGALTRRQMFTLGVCILLNLLLYGYTLAPMVSSISGSASWFLKPGFMELFYIPSFIFGGGVQYGLYSLAALCIWMGFKRRGLSHVGLLIICCSLVILFIIMLFMISQYKPMFVPRYAVFLAPVLFLGLSAWLGAGLKLSSCAGNVKSVAVIGLVLVSLCWSIFDSMALGPFLRPLGWDIISYNSICTRMNCGFVLDDPIIPFTPDRAYQQLSNFPVRYRNPGIEWEAVRPERLSNWLSENPEKPFVYVQSARPVADIHALMLKNNLICAREERQPGSFLCISNKARNSMKM